MITEHEREKIENELSKASKNLLKLMLKADCPDLGINIPNEFTRAKHNALAKLGEDLTIAIILASMRSMLAK